MSRSLILSFFVGDYVLISSVYVCERDRERTHMSKLKIDLWSSCTELKSVVDSAIKYHFVLTYVVDFTTFISQIFLFQQFLGFGIEEGIFLCPSVKDPFFSQLCLLQF